MTLVVGLGGGVASGKSTVERAFEARSVPVIDADRVARDVVMPGEPALDAIADAFGAGMIAPDGGLDRARMRALVFADDAARRQLEAITHPAIRSRLEDWREGLQAPYGVLSAAILVESGLSRLCDRLLVVDVPRETQHERLVARDGIDAALAERMLAAQADRETRLAAAHDVLSNHGDIAAIEDMVERFHDFYSRIATGALSPDERLHLGGPGAAR